MKTIFFLLALLTSFSVMYAVERSSIFSDREIHSWKQAWPEQDVGSVECLFISTKNLINSVGCVIYIPYPGQKNPLAKNSLLRTVLAENPNLCAMTVLFDCESSNLHDNKKSYYYKKSGSHQVVADARMEMIRRGLITEGTQITAMGHSGGASAVQCMVDSLPWIEQVVLVAGRVLPLSKRPVKFTLMVYSWKDPAVHKSNQSLATYLREKTSAKSLLLQVSQQGGRRGSNRLLFRHVEAKRSHVFVAKSIAQLYAGAQWVRYADDLIIDKREMFSDDIIAERVRIGLGWYPSEEIKRAAQDLRLHIEDKGMYTLAALQSGVMNARDVRTVGIVVSNPTFGADEPTWDAIAFADSMYPTIAMSFSGWKEVSAASRALTERFPNAELVVVVGEGVQKPTQRDMGFVKKLTRLYIIRQMDENAKKISITKLDGDLASILPIHILSGARSKKTKDKRIITIRLPHHPVARHEKSIKRILVDIQSVRHH